MSARELSIGTAMRSVKAAPQAQGKRPPSRRNKRGWLVWLDPETARSLKITAAANDTTLQALGEEAADWILQRYQ